jgi:hypothetical protein
MKKRMEQEGRAEEKKKGGGRKKAAGDEGAAKDKVVWHGRPKVPPPECEIWPEEIRAEFRQRKASGGSGRDAADG